MLARAWRSSRLYASTSAPGGLTHILVPRGPRDPPSTSGRTHLPSAKAARNVFSSPQRTQDSDAAADVWLPGHGGDASIAKRLTRNIRGAGSARELLEQLDRHHQHINYVHVSAAFTRLAHIHVAPHGRTSTGTQAHEPDAQLLVDTLQHMTLAMLPQMRPRELSNILWATARVGPHPGHDWLAAWMGRARQCLPQFNAQDMSNTLWALARLRFYPEPHWMQAALQHSSSTLSTMDVQSLVNMGWALATLDYVPDANWLRAWQSALMQHLHNMMPQGHANALWAAVHLSSPATRHDAINPEWLNHVVSMLQHDPSQFAPKELSMVLFSLARARQAHAVPQSALSAAASAAFACLHQLQVSEAAWMMWGLAHLGHAPSYSQMGLFFQCTGPLLAYADAKTLANLAYTLCRLRKVQRQCQAQAGSTAAAAAHSMAGGTGPSAGVVAPPPTVVEQYAAPPADWVEALLDSVKPQLPAMDARTAATLAHSLSELGVQPPAVWTSNLLSAVQVHLQPHSQLRAADLMCLSVALARWRAAPNAAWAACLISCVLAALPHASAKEGANTLLALAHLRCEGLQPVMDALGALWASGEVPVRSKDLEQVSKAAHRAGLDMVWVQQWQCAQ